MGDRPRPIEEIAAEEIAADEDRSRDWVAPKAIVGLPLLGGQAAQNSFFGRLFQLGALPFIGALALVLAVVVGAFALFGPGRQPAATSSAPAVAEGTATLGPTDEPPATPPPTPEPTDEPTPAPSPDPTEQAPATESPSAAGTLDVSEPRAFSDPPDDVVLVDDAGSDLGAAPPGHTADIIQTDYQAVNGDVTFCVSRPNKSAQSWSSLVEYFIGNILAYWSFHDGELETRAYRGGTDEDVPGATFPVDAVGGRVCVSIPKEQTAGIDAFAVQSLDRPNEGDMVGRDRFGPIDLSIPCGGQCQQ